MIPDEMIMNCRLLAYDDEVTPYLMERFKEAASGVAGAFRMQHEFRRISYVPGIEATPEWTDRLLKSAVKILPAGRINTEPEVKRGAEDFSFIGNRLKERTCFFLGAGPDEETAYEYGQHSSKVIFNENTLPVGIALESTMVFDYLNSDEE
jgi:metal-dependent amidase/aminoacylase/carboxypeptidase family protein